MTKSRLNAFSTLAILWLALFASRVVTQAMFEDSVLPTSPLTSALSDLLVAAALLALAHRSRRHGWPLALALAAIPLSASVINIVEAFLFLPDAVRDGGKLLTAILIGFASTAVALHATSRHPTASAHGIGTGPRDGLRVGGFAWRLALAGLVYTAIYFLAGIAAYSIPEVRAFYATQSLPPPVQLLMVQVLVRGPALALLCLLIVRIGSAGTLRTALCFATVTAIAPLLVPNPYFPDAVRWVHFVEVVGSNLLFGAAMARLWRPHAPRGAPQRSSAFG